MADGSGELRARQTGDAAVAAAVEPEKEKAERREIRVAYPIPRLPVF
jgi:hypothetical protein